MPAAEFNLAGLTSFIGYRHRGVINAMNDTTQITLQYA